MQLYLAGVRAGVMSESRELFFEPDDARRYGKLTVAIHDLGSVVGYGHFILKKDWKAKPWSRGTTYLQQSAFVTAMVVSYGRAFGASFGYTRFPEELLTVFDQDEMKVHKSTLADRHQLYAHSDAVNYGVRPWRSEFHSDIYKTPVFEMSHDRIEKLIAMSRKMIAAIRDELRSIKDRYP